ncbi:MAG: hypothetical protein F4160_19285 [Rhodospirillaceae bacterium]|nr:hypothetical protein [Alphaproteobacteria bacterium]MYF06864.1 hypothetical protein [Rhodospirillaceae bacterium]MYH38933.1 hypothetical protein [Rhodospirillaceae bacterium]
MTTTSTARRRHSWRERLFVLGGFPVAALYTVAAAMLGLDMETVGAAWLAAILWTVPSSLTLALRSGFVHRDWSAFRDYELPDGSRDNFDFGTRTGSYAYLRIAEEHERLMRGN